MCRSATRSKRCCRRLGGRLVHRILGINHRRSSVPILPSIASVRPRLEIPLVDSRARRTAPSPLLLIEDQPRSNRRARGWRSSSSPWPACAHAWQCRSEWTRFDEQTSLSQPCPLSYTIVHQIAPLEWATPAEFADAVFGSLAYCRDDSWEDFCLLRSARHLLDCRTRHGTIQGVGMARLAISFAEIVL
jgi:hypothetical protein